MKYKFRESEAIKVTEDICKAYNHARPRGSNPISRERLVRQNAPFSRHMHDIIGFLLDKCIIFGAHTKTGKQAYEPYENCLKSIDDLTTILDMLPTGSCMDEIQDTPETEFSKIEIEYENIAAGNGSKDREAIRFLLRNELIKDDGDGYEVNGSLFANEDKLAELRKQFISIRKAEKIEEIPDYSHVIDDDELLESVVIKNKTLMTRPDMMLKVFLGAPDFKERESRDLTEYLKKYNYHNELTTRYFYNFISLYNKRQARQFKIRQCKIDPERLWVRRVK